MRHRIRLLYVVAAAFVIAASGLMIINRLDQDIAVMRDINAEIRLQQVAVSAQQSDYLQEPARKEAPVYIRTMARGYGYLMPGEILFEVVNPEVFDDVGEGTP